MGSVCGLIRLCLVSLAASLSGSDAVRKGTALELALHGSGALKRRIILIWLSLRNNLFYLRQSMSGAFYAGPLYGAATRTLTQAAATTMNAVQRSTAVQHLPPIPLADLRPVDPRTQYDLALAAMAPMATAYIPAAQQVPSTDSGLRNLGASSRPKGWVWGDPY